MEILETIGEYIAACIILIAIGYTILGGIGYIIYMRKNKNDI